MVPKLILASHTGLIMGMVTPRVDQFNPVLEPARVLPKLILCRVLGCLVPLRDVPPSDLSVKGCINLQVVLSFIVHVYHFLIDVAYIFCAIGCR